MVEKLKHPTPQPNSKQNKPQTKKQPDSKPTGSGTANAHNHTKKAIVMGRLHFYVGVLMGLFG
jgi:hypothetical protein